MAFVKIPLRATMEYTADNTTMAAMAPFSCHFVRRRQCQHDQLFQATYLRTNRTNHTKIMRCFPHCCPGHRERSYCGSSVFFQLDQSMQTSSPSPSVLTSDQLVVYARFRPTTAAPLMVGDCVDLTTIEEGLQHKDPSKGEWIESDLSHCTVDPSDGTISWVLEVNASGRWYYPWSGAATNALRATSHVFEVLAFRRHVGATTKLQLLASVVSSTFHLKSFRRASGAAANSSSNQTKAAMTPTDSPRAAAPQYKSQSPAKKPTIQRVTGKRTRVDDTMTLHEMAQARASAIKHKFMRPPVVSQLPSIFTSVMLPRPTSPTSVMALPSFSTLVSSPANRLHIPVREREPRVLPWLDQRRPLSCGGSRPLPDWEGIAMDASRSRSPLRIPRPTMHHREEFALMLPVPRWPRASSPMSLSAILSPMTAP